MTNDLDIDLDYVFDALIAANEHMACSCKAGTEDGPCPSCQANHASAIVDRMRKQSLASAVPAGPSQKEIEEFQRTWRENNNRGPFGYLSSDVVNDLLADFAAQFFAPSPATGQPPQLVMGMGEYNCALCGMGMVEPCEHWKLFEESAAVPAPESVAPQDRKERILQIIKEWEAVAKEMLPLMHGQQSGKDYLDHIAQIPHAAANPSKVEEVARAVVDYLVPAAIGVGRESYYDGTAAILRPYLQVSEPPEIAYERKVLDHRTGEVGFVAAPVAPVSGNGTEPQSEICLYSCTNEKYDIRCRVHNGAQSHAEGGNGEMSNRYPMQCKRCNGVLEHELDEACHGDGFCAIQSDTPTEAPKAQEPLCVHCGGREGHLIHRAGKGFKNAHPFKPVAAPQAESAGTERGCINHDQIREGCPHCDIEHLARVDSATIARLRTERDALRETLRAIRKQQKEDFVRAETSEAEVVRLKAALEHIKKTVGDHDWPNHVDQIDEVRCAVLAALSVAAQSPKEQGK